MDQPRPTDGRNDRRTGSRGQPGSLFPDLEATGQAGSPRPTGQAQQEGDAAHAGGCPAGPEPAASPAATTPAAPEPGRPGAGEAPATAAQADPSGAGQADGQAEAPAAIPAAGQATGQTDGQTDGQAGGQAASAGDLDPRRLWLRAVEELAGELPPAVLEGLRDATARWGGTKPPGPRTYDLRCRCGSAAWNLTVLLRPPHYGHAVRCVCTRCRRVLGLLWWADGPGPLVDDPPHPGELAARS
jgi:hypothetical protein